MRWPARRGRLMSLAIPAPSVPLRRRRFSAAVQNATFAYALVLPVVLLLLGLVAYPFFYAIFISFTDRVVGNPGKWIGLANFHYLMRSPAFASSIWNTVVLVVVSDICKLALGLGLALLVSEKLRGRGVFRALLMLPWAMPAFVVFLTWRVLYQPIGGGINLELTDSGIWPEGVDSLGQRSTAITPVLPASVWRGFAFLVASLLAALPTIPRALYDAPPGG